MPDAKLLNWIVKYFRLSPEEAEGVRQAAKDNPRAMFTYRMIYRSVTRKELSEKRSAQHAIARRTTLRR